MTEPERMMDLGGDAQERATLADQLEDLRLNCPCGTWLLQEAADTLSELQGALRAIVAMEPEPFPFDPVAWGAEVDACVECRRYAGHPIQGGICNAHRQPLWRRDDHDKREQARMHYRMRDIARAAVSKAEGRQ